MVLPAEAAASLVGEPGWALPNLHMHHQDGRAGLCLMLSCALYTVGAATSAWRGRQVLPETGVAALQQ